MVSMLLVVALRDDDRVLQQLCHSATASSSFSSGGVMTMHGNGKGKAKDTVFFFFLMIEAKGGDDTEDIKRPC